MRSFRSTFLLVLATGVVAGCFGSFNPDERKYLCDNTQACIEGYVCVKSEPTQSDYIPVPTQPDDNPVPTRTDDMPSETAPSGRYFCARECGDQSMCPTGSRCGSTETVDGNRISVCRSDDASDEMMETASEIGTNAEIQSDASLDSARVDTGVAVDISFSPEDCEGLGCNQPEVWDAGAGAIVPDASVADNGCHSACTRYCDFTETQCQLPCSLSQCVGVCDASDGAISNDIIAQTLVAEGNCGRIVNGGNDMNATVALDIEYGNLAVSCMEFCQELDAYLTDPINGAGEVCGEYLQCDQLDCIDACETRTNEFVENLGEIIFNQTHAICPLAKKLATDVNDTSRHVSVKNVCIPCESTCSVLFPDDGSADEGSSAFWCGEEQEQSPCPAISSKSVCTQQCEAHPEQFFVSNASEICGDSSAADEQSVIAYSTPLCGAQCQSTNTDWGDVGSFTEQPLTLTHVLAGTTRTITVERGTRICFREQGFRPGNTPRCDVVISIDEQRFASFEVVFDPIGQGGLSLDPSQNMFKYAAKFTAHGESTVTENLFGMVVYPSNSTRDMLLSESITNPNSDFDGQVHDVATPTINDGDVALISRRIGGDEYRMAFVFNDVQTPSALSIDHFTIGSTADIDGSCQNQCFERSGGAFCRDLCDPDEGLMALCAQNIDMPRRAQVAFTSNLSASGEPQNPFCGQGEETSGRQLSKAFDADSCMRECKRNRCDLQFQVNALWHPGRASEGGRCHRLNFGGYQGWRVDENFPDDSGEPLDRSSLCCLCSQDYCEAILSNRSISIDCGN